MKITSVSARILEGRPERPVEFAMGPYHTFTMVLVEVATDEGIKGYGEAIARRGARMTKHAVEALLAPVLQGEDPYNIEGLWVKMMNQLRRWGHSKGVVIEAISGVDTALWDLVGKAEGKPVWRLLLGAGRSCIPCYASSVYINDLEAMCAEAVKQVEKGFRALKVKIGRPMEVGGIKADIEAVRRIREAVGDDVQIMLDANGAYDAGTAIRVARQLEPLDITWLEEPVPPDDLDGYARVHSMTSIPLATGETEFSVFGFRDLISRRLIDVVQPDLGRCGGITGARQVATLCYAHNVLLAPHTGFSGGISQLAAIHIAAASPTLFTYEYMFIDNPLQRIFVGGFPEPENGLLAVPQGPGLGLELDWTLVEKYTVD